MKLEEIAKAFGINDIKVEEEHITIGHINVTYRAKFGKTNYIMQRMNKFVFKNPPRLMDNVSAVTDYIRNELNSKGLDTERYVLNFLKTTDGKYYFVDDEGEYWRMYYYIENSTTYNSIDNLEIMEGAGSAFGEFQCQLAGYDAGSLFETIPNFHNTIDRYRLLKEAKEKDEFNRFKSVKDVYEKYMELESVACKMTEMLNNKELPLRVTHNDTKCNNVLFDLDTNKSLAVIDLDTVMPGLAGFDFGDSIRTGGSSAKEDETDLSKIYVKLDNFEAFAKGFLSKTKNSLTKNEIDTLALGAITMTTECGVRFLTDYLQNDVYFKPKYKEQNIIRARCQLKLAQDMLANLDKMNEIIKNI